MKVTSKQGAIFFNFTSNSYNISFSKQKDFIDLDMYNYTKSAKIEIYLNNKKIFQPLYRNNFITNYDFVITMRIE